MSNKYDVVVIGGGAAGMMAAFCAAEGGERVALLERNTTLGRKVLLTGNGRCNVTHVGDDHHTFCIRFGKQGRFLYSVLNQCDADDTVALFNGLGLKTKVEEKGRIFPVSDKAADVVRALECALRAHNVAMYFETSVQQIGVVDGRVRTVTTNRMECAAETVIVATGGMSFPGTGSRGDGYGWARNLGHSVIDPVPALSAVRLRNIAGKNVHGISFSDVSAVVRSGKIKLFARGDVLFTHDGISGPAIFDISGGLARALTEAEDVSLTLDLLPQYLPEEYEKILDDAIASQPKRQVFKTVSLFMPERFARFLLDLCTIDSSKQSNHLSRKERLQIIRAVKSFECDVSEVVGFENAYLTSGGVALREIDAKTMQSKIIKNLFFAGEVIDLDGPTGGFNLQIAWSTGFVAGKSAAAMCHK